MVVDIFNTDKKYNIIYADPPWRYNDEGCNGNAASHYQTMKLNDICSLPIAKLAAKDSILFMWATYPQLGEALKVINAWGFTYKTIAFQWIKKNKSGRGYFFGLGRWTRGNAEPCLLAVRGKPKRVDNSISQLLVSPIARHSEKPNAARRQIVKLVGDIPKIELFARQQLSNWDCWGNEIGEMREQISLVEK